MEAPESTIEENKKEQQDNDLMMMNHVHYLLNDKVADNLLIPRGKISGCLMKGAECDSFVPIDERIIIEAKCNGITGIFYCHVPEELLPELSIDDLVLVKCDDSTEIAFVREIGNIVKAKRQRTGLYGEQLPLLIRKSNEEDLVIHKKNLADEEKAKESFKTKAVKYNLVMKLIDVHFQFDRNKLFFFYTADGRIDFRELAKDLAAEFKTRIELRQIGVRDEAKRVGGMGVCGREFCCSSFLCNFKKIPTHLTTEQNISANFSKLSGPCGKLKCCLSFECECNKSSNE